MIFEKASVRMKKDGHEVIGKLYNEHWVRPSEAETIRKSEAVEGCPSFIFDTISFMLSTFNLPVTFTKKLSPSKSTLFWNRCEFLALRDEKERLRQYEESIRFFIRTEAFSILRSLFHGSLPAPRPL